MIQLQTTEDIARAIGAAPSYIANIVSNADRFYKPFCIVKPNGGMRQLEAPSRRLKGIQTWILRNVLDSLPVSERAFGFVKGGSTKKHALMHATRNYVLIMDVKDFFPSISSARVRDVFVGCGLGPEGARLLTLLCTYQGRLPQGGVTSPLLSNLVFFAVDQELKSKCDQLGIRYSRYADDLAFSADTVEPLKNLEAQVTQVLLVHGFTINARKTRYLTGKGKMLITGLFINARRPTTGRQRKRELRAGLYNAIVKGDKSVNMASLLGNLAYIRSVEPDYYERVRGYVRKLQSRK
jgi:retron-type reverse transcriptase